MTAFNFQEKSDVFKYALLTTKISSIIAKVEKKQFLNDTEIKTMQRGAEFLKKLIKGSLLINRKSDHNGLRPSQEVLLTYAYALSALKETNITENSDIIKLFDTLLKMMNGLINKKTLSNEQLIIIKKFFDSLSTLLSDEAQKEKWFDLAPEPIYRSAIHS